jgi:hypothetical protein
LLQAIRGNLAKWKPHHRKANCWGFWVPSQGPIQKATPQELSCIVCRKYPSKSRKATTTYKESSGTGGLSGHCTRFQSFSKTELRKSFFSKQKPTYHHVRQHTGAEQYPEGHPIQQAFIEGQVLEFAKDYTPLTIVERPFFVAKMLGLDHRLKIPRRADFRHKHIPAIYALTKEKYVIPKLKNSILVQLLTICG